MIADQNLIEMLVSDEFFLITFGALECINILNLDDIESFQSQKFVRHRKFLKEESKFKNIFQIQDSSILEKIHSNYRLSYLRDTATARFIEEDTVKNINIMIHYNNTDIIQFFISNTQILNVLLQIIDSRNIDDKYEGMSFLMELNKICRETVICMFI